MTAFGQSDLDCECKPPSRCYNRRADSMAIEARLFQMEYEKVIKSYQSDSISYEATITQDSIILATKKLELQKCKAKLESTRKMAKIRTYVVGGLTAYGGWLLRKLIFN